MTTSDKDDSVAATAANTLIASSATIMPGLEFDDNSEVMSLALGLWCEEVGISRPEYTSRSIQLGRSCEHKPYSGYLGSN